CLAPPVGSQLFRFGAQAGFPAGLTGRVAGRAPGGVDLHVATARASDDAPDLAAVWPEDIDALGPDGVWQLAAPLPAFLCPSPPGIDVDGVPVRVHVDLVDRGSQEVLAAASAEVTPHCPTADPEELASCQRLCSGGPL